MNVILINTNIVLRHLLADHVKLSPEAKKIFLNAENGEQQIYFDEIILAETLWVLESFYKLQKQNIAVQLKSLISPKWILNPKKKLMLNALQRYSESKLSYIDCWLLEMSRFEKMKLESFDRELQRSSTSEKTA